MSKLRNFFSIERGPSNVGKLNWDLLGFFSFIFSVTWGALCEEISQSPITFEVFDGYEQKYSRLRCLLRVKGLVICFYLGWSSVQTKYSKVRSKSRLFTCSSNITLSLTSYTDPALKRELNFCNSYLSLLYFYQ